MSLKEFCRKMSLKIMEKSKTSKLYSTITDNLLYYILCAVGVLYCYGIVINSFITATQNFKTGTNEKPFSLNPFKCLAAVFTVQSLGVLFFCFLVYLFMTGKWLHFLTGTKITKDDRNFYVTDEGTHGTSGWMTKKERDKILYSDTADNLPTPILCKIKRGKYDDRMNDYIGLREDCGLNKHIIVYGATGAGKSRGFVKPYILKMVQMMKAGQKPQSMIIVDPKAGATRF